MKQILIPLTFFTLVLNHAFYADAINVEIQNNCLYPIWPAIFTIKGKPITPTGFKMDHLQLVSLNVSDDWTGRIYPRTFCSKSGKGKNQRFHCDLGDCGTGNIRCYGKASIPPVTSVKLSMAPENGTSSYYIDLKNGLNVPVSVIPFDNSCIKPFCLKDLKSSCPNWLAVYDHQGAMIGCKSVCLVTGNMKDCCKGEYAGIGKCPLNQYSEFVENECPRTVTHPLSTRKYTCYGGIGYRINFCS